MTHSRFPSPANDYTEDSIDLSREVYDAIFETLGIKVEIRAAQGQLVPPT